MHKLSSILAFITNKVFIVLLIITVLAMAQAVAVAQVITNKDKVKAVLAESNIYSNLPENAIYIIKLGGDESESSEESAESKTIYQLIEEAGFIKAEELNNVIIKVVSPEFLQTQTEQLIDNSYAFLDGENKELLFAFSLKSQADVANNELSKLINAKLASLPTCNVQQIIEQANQDINILEAVCLPPGVSLQSKINKFLNELTAADGIFAQEFTQKDVQISDTDANLAKYVYNSLKSLTWMFWLLVISFSAVIILTSKTLHRGLKVVGSILAILGLVLLGSYLFYVGNYNFAENAVTNNQELSPREAEALNSIVSPVYSSFADQVVSQITIISAILIIFGVLLFVLGIFATKHHVEHLYIPIHKKPKEQPEYKISPSNKSAEIKTDETPTADSQDQKTDPKPQESAKPKKE